MGEKEDKSLSKKLNQGSSLEGNTNATAAGKKLWGW